MIKIRAKIKLYNIRKTPFRSGYRPLFDFGSKNKTSGHITLLDKQEFLPGEEAYVEIAFLNRQYLGKDFQEGTTFFFGEGVYTLGEGKVSFIY
ncbi:MAG: hypothetical protein AB8E82_14555 [Aureispira sp.]|jgi:elongation factor Tu